MALKSTHLQIVQTLFEFQFWSLTVSGPFNHLDTHNLFLKFNKIRFKNILTTYCSLIIFSKIPKVFDKEAQKNLFY